MIYTLDDALALHDESVVIDLHADTAKLMAKTGLDITREHARILPGAGNLVGHIDLPRLTQGKVTAQFFSYWTFPLPERGCARDVHAQINAVDAVTHTDAGLRWTLSADAVCDAKRAGYIGALGGIEGGQALEGDVTRIAEFAARGVRYLGLLHFSANAIGAPAHGRGADPDRGLSGFGIEVVRACEAAGVVIDLAHINRKGYFDALSYARLPPMVSHTGVSGVHAHWRNIDDEQIRAVAERGGVIGVIFSRRYLGSKSIDAVVDHLLHVLRIGGEEVAALGSDFDGFVAPPVGLEDVSCLPQLTLRLMQRGVGIATIKKLLGENVLRVLSACPPKVSHG